MIGFRWYERNDPPEGWGETQVRDFSHLLRRRLGTYFRGRYPHFKGDLFARDPNNFTLAGNPDAFQAQAKYVHHNSVHARIFDVYEENPFCSFPLYLSAFVHNPEVQALPAVQRVKGDPGFLPIYEALDMEYAIGQYPGHFDKRVRTFMRQHLTNLNYKNRNAARRHDELGVGPLFRGLDALQIANTSGHQAKRLIDQINGRKSEILLAGGELDLPPDLFNAFTSCFSPDADAKHIFSRIREQYPAEFWAFLECMGKRVGIKPTSRETGVHRATIRKLLTQ